MSVLAALVSPVGLMDADRRPSWTQDKVSGMSCCCEASSIEDLIIQTGEARRGPKRSGMSERDAVVPRGGSIGLRTA